MSHVKVGSRVKIDIHNYSTLCMFGQYQGCEGTVYRKRKAQAPLDTKMYLYDVQIDTDKNCIACLRDEFILLGDTNDSNTSLSK